MIIARRQHHIVEKVPALWTDGALYILSVLFSINRASETFFLKSRIMSTSKNCYDENIK